MLSSFSFYFITLTSWICLHNDFRYSFDDRTCYCYSSLNDLLSLCSKPSPLFAASLLYSSIQAAANNSNSVFAPHVTNSPKWFALKHKISSFSILQDFQIVEYYLPSWRIHSSRKTYPVFQWNKESVTLKHTLMKLYGNNHLVPIELKCMYHARNRQNGHCNQKEPYRVDLRDDLLFGSED